MHHINPFSSSSSRLSGCWGEGIRRAGDDGDWGLPGFEVSAPLGLHILQREKHNLCTCLICYFLWYNASTKRCEKKSEKIVYRLMKNFDYKNDYSLRDKTYGVALRSSSWLKRSFRGSEELLMLPTSSISLPLLPAFCHHWSCRKCTKLQLTLL